MSFKVVVTAMHQIMIATAIAFIAVAVNGCGGGGGCTFSASGVTDGFHQTRNVDYTISADPKLSNDCCDALKSSVTSGQPDPSQCHDDITSITVEASFDGASCSGTTCSASIPGSSVAIEVDIYGLPQDCCSWLGGGAVGTPPALCKVAYCAKMTIKDAGSSKDEWLLLTKHTESFLRAFQPREALAREAPAADNATAAFSNELKKILGLSMRRKSAPRTQDVSCNDTTTCQDGYKCCYDGQSNPCGCCPSAETCDPDCAHCDSATDNFGKKLKKILRLSMRPKDTTKDITAKISAPRMQEVSCNDTTTCQDGYKCCYDGQSNPCGCCPSAETCDPDCAHCDNAADAFGKKLEKILGLSVAQKLPKLVV